MTYFNWLLDQSISGYMDYTAAGVFEIMHDHKFIPQNEYDQNRVDDVQELRAEYGLEGDELVNPEPSVFEVLVALSRRAAFASFSTTPSMWMDIFLMNLGLDEEEVRSDYEPVDTNVVESVIFDLNHGLVTPFPINGQPLRDTLWYQMMDYIQLNGLN